MIIIKSRTVYNVRSSYAHYFYNRVSNELSKCHTILFKLQHKLKFSQRDKVKKFITFTQTGEQTAIYCLAQNDWKLDLASDNYFQNPEAYYKEPKNSVDKKKLEILYNKYQGKIANIISNCKFLLYYLYSIL